MSIQLNKLTGLILLCLALFSSVLVAQDFSAQNSKYSPAIYGDKFTYEEDKFFYFNELAGVLFLKGKIEKGMYKDFRQAITDNNIHTLVLDSPGGNVSEGLQIAGTVFDRKIKTYIRKNQNCASACSFIFLSGKTRYTLGKLGVHQIAFDEEFSKKKEEVGLIGEVIQINNSDIVQYLDENNTPGFVYKYMLRTPSDEMYYFNEDELNQLGNSNISSQDKLHFNRIDNFIRDYNSHLIKTKCDTDPGSCTITQLCSQASKDKEWRTSLDAAKFVKLAKSKGYRCGVPVTVCPENIKKCNKEYLCTYGTTSMDTGLSWLNNSNADEAKRRGLSCSVVATPAFSFDTLASSAMVMDQTTGTVLMAKNADLRVPPASMSKLMTLYMLFEALRDERIAFDTEFLVSEKAAKIGGSTMFLREGERVSVRDLIQGIIVQSGNDACVTVAENLAGTETAFADQMTKRAIELGMNNSSFGNSTGWPDPLQRMSARDLVLIADLLIKDFPNYYPFFAQASFTWDGVKQNNRNPLLALGIGADGLKTGHTNEAGYGLVGSARQGNRRIIFMITGLETKAARANEAEKLANWAFGKFVNKN